MATAYPDGWRELAVTGVAQREIETLKLLAEGLPETYAVYHGVHWTRVRQGYAAIGEIDFVVVSPAGGLLLIEQKSGLLDETAAGLVKHYGKTAEVVPARLARNAEALRARLDRLLADGEVAVETLLYCPDYQVRHPGGAGIDPARIVDAARKAHLLAVIRAILPERQESSPRLPALHRFLLDELELVPEINAAVGAAARLYTRLSGGLAHWARRVECSPFRLRVIGTAGSGKTQLALAAYRDALTAGRRPLYVCYNRPLADHIALQAPPGGMVATYHQLCDRVARAHGDIPDFSRADAFRLLEEAFATRAFDDAWRFDELIVDEGQDFQPAWRDALMRLLRPEGRAWWLEDPMQNLYGRPPPELPGWVTLRSETNYRSPREVLDWLNRLHPAEPPWRAGSPIAGMDIECLTYDDGAGLIERTKSAITRGLGLGFRRDMIAVVSFRGREHSLLTPHTRLGPHALRAFTGDYDLLGNPVYSEGEIRLDSVYRFKGQAAPCVVFTEIDCAEADALALRKLFVGMTRATMKLFLVMSEPAARSLLARVAN